MRRLRRELKWLRIENEVLHEAAVPLIHQAPARERFAFIDRLRDRFAVKRLCRILVTDLCNYYLWTRGEARRQAHTAKERELLELIVEIHTAHPAYGAERITRELKRQGFEFGRETTEGETTHTYRNTASNSGGEQEKLVAFCLAAALSYNLADEDSDGRPRFAPLMLDEAFSKSDESFASQALSAFDEFGFQLLIAAPIRMSGVLEPFIGQAVLVDKKLMPDGAHSAARTATFGELAVRRVAENDGLADAHT